MTKRLLLLRHAQSDPIYSGMDKGRPLTPKGLGDAAALGHYMRKKGLIPDYVLCSDAWRTRETLEQLREYLDQDLNPEQISFLSVLYIGSEEQYLAEVQSCDDAYDTVLLIGHYPIIPALLHMLADASEKLTYSVLSGYQPAMLSILDCEIEKWEDLDYSSKNTVYDIISTNDYGKK